MEEKEVQNFLDKAWDFLSNLLISVFDGISTVIDTLPPIVTGGIFFVVLLTWVWHKVKN